VEYSPTEPHHLLFSSLDHKKISLKDALEILNSGLEKAVSLLQKATEGISLEQKMEVAAKIDLTKAVDKNKSFVSSMKSRRDKKSNRSRVSR
jgi:hypothetical protein